MTSIGCGLRAQVSVYDYLVAWNCGVASLMVAYSLIVGGLGDLLLSFSLSGPGRSVSESCMNEHLRCSIRNLLSMYRAW